ncbi:uncharacterized protein LOC109718133 [Ananas comosus]|uniref:Uncharacterized protein LOC109718133 n=1 Tax=Ananas comosus TaxID=4615 RepID=A0A6P5FUV6_ANACO|nr:uncharacterized protein LOC109718133 [Ananas comosus]
MIQFVRLLQPGMSAFHSPIEKDQRTRGLLARGKELVLENQLNGGVLMTEISTLENFSNKWDLTPHLGHYIIHLISVGMKLVAKIHQGEHDDIYLLVVLACIQLFQAAVKEN